MLCAKACVRYHHPWCWCSKWLIEGVQFELVSVGIVRWLDGFLQLQAFCRYSRALASTCLLNVWSPTDMWPAVLASGADLAITVQDSDIAVALFELHGSETWRISKLQSNLGLVWSTDGGRACLERCSVSSYAAGGWCKDGKAECHCHCVLVEFIINDVFCLSPIATQSASLPL